MLTFLRKIRRSLIESGSARKYALYAIGEVLLVVIGILIALQMNNWNEHRKARSFELKMLAEISESLANDTAYFHMLTERLTWIDTSSERIIYLLIDGVNNESLFLHHLRNIDHPYTFQYQDGAFEALKASGIENVSDDALRKNLIDHYGFRLPRWEKLMKINRTDSDLKLAKDLEWELFSFKPDAWKGDVGISKRALKPGVIGSDAFNRYVRIKRQDARNGLKWLEQLTRHTESLLNRLNEELNNSEQ